LIRTPATHILASFVVFEDKKSYLFKAQKATEIGTAVLISPQVTRI
jgi:hypothetical protein